MLFSQPSFSIPDISTMVAPIPDISKMVGSIASMSDISKMVAPIPDISEMVGSIASMPDISNLFGSTFFASASQVAKLASSLSATSNLYVSASQTSRLVDSFTAPSKLFESVSQIAKLASSFLDTSNLFGSGLVQNYLLSFPPPERFEPDEEEILNQFEQELLKLSSTPIERVRAASNNDLFTVLDRATHNSFVKNVITSACGWLRRVAIAIVYARHSNSVDESTFDPWMAKVRSFANKVRSFANFVSKILSSRRRVPCRSSSCLSKISRYLRNYWPPDKLTKPIAFVVNNADWKLRCSLLSTPLVPASCMGSKILL